jgi:Holliday junction resolvasome RuvABC endonuclease subunit
MLSLGLDPSLKGYGWCVYDSDAIPQLKRVASGHESTLPSTVPVARFMHLRALVNSLLQKFDVKIVGIESPAYSGGPFSETHFGLMMFSLEAIFEKRKDCVLFDPTTVKHLIGKSTFSKSDIQKYVQIDTLSTYQIDNNEADAYCIAKFASRFLNFKNGKTKVEELTLNELSVFLTRTKKKKRSASGIPVIQKTGHIFRENSRFFQFSQVPSGSVSLPNKSNIDQNLVKWLESNQK